jgi:membrane-associated phospholipid phosphatase
MPYITHLGTGAVIIFLSLLLLLKKRFRNPPFLLLMAVVYTVPFLLTQLLKNTYLEPRPLKYFNHAEWIHLVPGQQMNYHLSFPSGHSEGVFAWLCFMSLLLPKKYAFLGFFFFLLALTVMYSRIYLSQHFFADVYAGSIIGGLGAFFCFLIMRCFFLRRAINKKRPQNV